MGAPGVEKNKTKSIKNSAEEVCAVLRLSVKIFFRKIIADSFLRASNAVRRY